MESKRPDFSAAVALAEVEYQEQLLRALVREMARLGWQSDASPGGVGVTQSRETVATPLFRFSYPRR